MKEKLKKKSIDLDLEKTILSDVDLENATGGARPGCCCQSSIGSDSCAGLSDNNFIKDVSRSSRRR